MRNKNRAHSILFIPSGWLGPRLNQLDVDTQKRLEAGLALWKKEPDQMIVVSGGLFRSSRVQTRPAADLMADWLEKRGVPRTWILREKISLDTYENVKLTLKACSEKNIAIKRVLIVSQFPHVIRAWIVFRLGYGVPSHCHLLWSRLSLWTLFQELFFVLHHVFDWRGASVFAARNRAQRAKRMA